MLIVFYASKLPTNDHPKTDEGHFLADIKSFFTTTRRSIFGA